ncbi:MAG: DUF167 domain-containing protein [Chloroflexota bacterium]|nr:DUF167 domain-containing protein [Chloroflexota bacterium]
MGHIRVRVTPGARDSSVRGWQGDVLRLRVREKAEKGRANEAVAKLIAKSLGVPPGAVAIKHGTTSREKLFEVDGLDDNEVRRRLGAPML